MSKNVVVLFTFFFFIASLCLSSSPDRFLRLVTPSLRLRNEQPQEYVELRRPLLSDHLTPSCAHTVLRHSFANTINGPAFTAPYSPPSDCASPPWSHVVLELRAASSGDQYDRISGLWLGGVELLRTSTAEPTPSGIFWKVQKVVTRYSSLFMKPDLNVTMMLENVVNEVYTGIFHVNVTLLFYKENASKITNQNFNKILGFRGIERKLAGEYLGNDYNKLGSSGLYGSKDQSPADLIIPICDSGRRGFWFMIEKESDLHSKRIQIPTNTHRIILELYVSYHGNDEFWFSNPPYSYIRTNNLTTGRGNGAYREVVLTIDGRYVGSEVPFPVIFTGGINPLSWEPVVAIGAFDLPSYDLDLTPSLGLLLDGKSHEFGISVTDGISFWLVNANLHLWLDHGSSSIEAKSTVYHNPDLSIVQIEEFRLLDGSFRIKAERKSRFAGWVKSGRGNLTTLVLSNFKVSSLVRFDKNGTYKGVKQRVKAKRVVEVRSETSKLVKRAVHKKRYPLKVITSTLPRLRENENMYLLVTNISHALNEKFSSGGFSSSFYDSQDSEGWMEVEDHSVLLGEASTRQSLSYEDVFGCYSQMVEAANGKIVQDDSTFSCGSSFWT